MSRYAAVLVVPLIVGILIAATVLLINGLRERRERRDTALREAVPPGFGDWRRFSAFLSVTLAGAEGDKGGGATNFGWLHVAYPLATVGVVVTLLAGCASTPPTPVTSIEPLVGKWAGTVTVGDAQISRSNGSREFFYLTINADRTLVATWGGNWCTGAVEVSNGKVTYKMQPHQYEGTIHYYAGPGKPTIYMEDTFWAFYAVASKQQ